MGQPKNKETLSDCCHLATPPGLAATPQYILDPSHSTIERGREYIGVLGRRCGRRSRFIFLCVVVGCGS